MSASIYAVIALVLVAAILYGLHLMSNVRKAASGNIICASAMGAAILLTMWRDASYASPYLWIAIAVGVAFGLFLSNKVKMIQMPQLVAFLHGFGGGAAALVGLIMLVDVGVENAFERVDACLALCSGMATITGSFVAAGKLHQVLPQKPVILPAHSRIAWSLLTVTCLALISYNIAPWIAPWLMLSVMFLGGALFGVVFTMRVGGADMPITISLLNSMGGISCAIAGFAVSDPLLIAVGGIIGSAGYMLTRVMCKAMNRRLLPILLGESTQVKPAASTASQRKTETKVSSATPAAPKEDKGANLAKMLGSAKRVIIVPGYGMALAQAQHKVKALADALEKNGAKVDYAIHPVAGRMPGHMNVLLAEADVDYEHLLEMEQVNPLFGEADVVIVVGANDVVNPAANTAEGTPIYGMPILEVDKAKNIIICNYDEKPGYAGVENPLYRNPKAIMLLGDAAKTVEKLTQAAEGKVDHADVKPEGASIKNSPDRLGEVLRSARRVIIVPGYGMALAQAQHKVKALADALEKNGAKVDYAIHPVAGRMPGHMNVLLAEADVDYEHLLEMDQVNPMFGEADLAIVVGANDVVNPAANTAEGTPIYGMPILEVDKAKNIIICNYDEKPGYAGVDNPLYKNPKARLLLGDAAKTVEKLVQAAEGKEDTDDAGAKAEAAPGKNSADRVGDVLRSARRVIIVPGYGMALAQAQHKVKALADALEKNGAKVDYAIHPVAGRMPGHMNVLLAEADVDYEHLLEMDQVNPLFGEADLAIVVGANDVVNPAANTAEGTPIYGMPILEVDKAKNIIICNYDEKPGYAGVENPLYSNPDVMLLLGDAAQTVEKLVEAVEGKEEAVQASVKTEAAPVKNSADRMGDVLRSARRVIIVPGYGMALAQAQHKVKALADELEKNGAKVDYAIHPVAGRMPGHMNVLLAEADVDYEHLLEMDQVNPLFGEADLAIVVGANDVVNPAANTAEGTPIYGMPILEVDKAKNIIICNYDEKPGYAGVENPLYARDDVILLLGDAQVSLDKLLSAIKND